MRKDITIEHLLKGGEKLNKSNNTTDYALDVDNSDLFLSLGDYSDYIKLNIYYTEKGEEKTIVDYKMFLKSNNKDISQVKTENELRNEIGLHSPGTYTDTFTLSEIGRPGAGFNGDTAYTYISYTFVDNDNIEYEMEYINPDSQLNLIEGNQYSVTFEVVEDQGEYEYNILTIK